MAGTLDLKEIDKIDDNIYRAVVAASKRARQIHVRVADELKKKLGEIENEEDLDEEFVDREKIVREFDHRPKPSQIALDEFMDRKLHITDKTDK